MTEPEHIDFHYLIGLARDKSVEGRTRLVQIVGDLFFDTDTVLRDAERNIMSDILRQLIHDVDMKVRQQLAERMASEINAPRDLISALANDQIEVIHPILTQSTIRQDIELIEIVEHRTFGHQLAIAIHESVSEVVSEALIGTGNVDVIKTLLENENADISGKAMEYLVEQSEKIDDIQVPLINRSDLGPDLAKRMYWWVSAALRKSIVEHFDIDSVELDKSIERAVKDLMGKPISKAENADNIDGMIKSLIGASKVTSSLMIQTLRQGEIALFEEMLSGLSNLNNKLVRRFVFEPVGGALAILCRSLQIMKPDFALIFLLSRSARPGDKIVDPSELTRALDLYDRIKLDTAHKVVEHWRLDPDYLFALKQLNAQQRQATG